MTYSHAYYNQIARLEHATRIQLHRITSDCLQYLGDTITDDNVKFVADIHRRIAANPAVNFEEVVGASLSEVCYAFATEIDNKRMPNIGYEVGSAIQNSGYRFCMEEVPRRVLSALVRFGLSHKEVREQIAQIIISRLGAQTESVRVQPIASNDEYDGEDSLILAEDNPFGQCREPISQGIA
jgi:energy-coupling factor transporter ATP-binding protein EcfA2